MTTRLLPFLLAALCCIASLAGAQTREPTANGRFVTLRSDQIVRTEDWPALRAAVLEAWDLTEVPELPFDDVGALGEQTLDAFASSSGGLEILSLMTPPQDDVILYTLAALFPDITAQDIDAFQEGVVIEITNRVGASGEIVVYFFALAAAQEDAGPPPTEPTPEVAAVEESLRPAMPEQSELVVQSPSSRGGWVYRYRTEASPGSLLVLFIEKLTFLEYEVEVRDLEGATAILADSPVYKIFILIERVLDDDAGAWVTIVIDTF